VCVIVVLQWCYSGATVVLQWCYRGVTMVLQDDMLFGCSVERVPMMLSCDAIIGQNINRGFAIHMKRIIKCYQVFF
jgi:hypothetical protein